MKRNTMFTASAIIFALLVISIIFNFKFINLVSQQRAKINTLQDTNTQLKEYKEALRLSDVIMDNNDLWDRDGSDVMSDYLNLRASMDTTFYHGFHENALLDSISYNYNE